MKILSKKINSSKLRLVAIVMVVAVSLAVAVAFMFMRTPARYKPAHPENADKVSPYLTNYLAPEIYNNVQLDAPFDLIITEEGLNDIIARDIWPQKAGGDNFYAPSVAFENGTIYLMGKVNYSRLPVVMTIVARAKLNPDGKIQINIETIKAGIVDITPFAMGRAEGILTDRVKDAGDRSWLADLSDALMKNAPIDPIFTVSAHKRQVRLTAIKIQEDVLTLTLKPQ
ncbi:MAG TPA: hypothetical protein ENH94_05520 [Phycisphaerales bacterium]|nr:hypothetical protein [Phycisphaerales bacterium]